MAEVLKLSVDDFAAHARSLASPDELSVYVAKQLMRQLSPESALGHPARYRHRPLRHLLALHRRHQTHRPALRRTLAGHSARIPNTRAGPRCFMMPDFGRDSDIESGGNGFQHHRTGDAISRTTWMLAIGPGCEAATWSSTAPWNRSISCPPSARYFGFDARFSTGKPIRGGGLSHAARASSQPPASPDTRREARATRGARRRPAAAPAPRLRAAAAARTDRLRLEIPRRARRTRPPIPLSQGPRLPNVAPDHVGIRAD